MELKRYKSEDVDGDTVYAEAHEVTDDTRGTVSTIGHARHEAVPGDLLIRTGNPNVYDVTTKKAFEDANWTLVDDSPAEDSSRVVPDPSPVSDPSNDDDDKNDDDDDADKAPSPSSRRGNVSGLRTSSVTKK